MVNIWWIYIMAVISHNKLSTTSHVFFSSPGRSHATYMFVKRRYPSGHVFLCEALAERCGMKSGPWTAHGADEISVISTAFWWLILFHPRFAVKDLSYLTILTSCVFPFNLVGFQSWEATLNISALDPLRTGQSCGWCHLCGLSGLRGFLSSNTRCEVGQLAF